MHSKRAALLLDLENILYHDGSSRWPWLQGTAAANILTRCLRTATSMLRRPPDRVFAVGCADLMRRTMFLSPLRSSACRVTPTEADAADRRLLEDADHLAGIGYTRFVIGSGDHIFSNFAAAHETYVLARPGTLSRELRQAARRSALIAPAIYQQGDVRGLATMDGPNRTEFVRQSIRPPRG